MKQFLNIVSRLAKMGVLKEFLWAVIDIISDVTIKTVYIIAIILAAWVSLLGAIVGIVWIIIKGARK